MVYAFDTLGYARRLQDAGIPRPQAEAHADAAREFVMGELVTRADLQTAIGHLEVKLEAKLEKLDAKIDKLELRMTVRLGFMMAAGIAILSAVIKLS